MLALLVTRRAAPVFLPPVRYKHTLYLLPKRSRRGWAIKWPRMKIKLTKEEDELCTLLDECTTHIKQTEGLETECRIAGGWVRDKLLGMNSNDIDVALSNMMGVTFATFFVDYCSKVKGLKVSQIAKIESNPEQSKHLETARATVLGRELDFVNLRSEEYSQDSRIPTRIEYGTPFQDAMRRDITINALFYNVHTKSVEDCTGKGLEDLKAGVIRTPMNALETFRDDPLRVLRAIRFSARFGFQLSSQVEYAAKNKEIQQALGAKISRERIGTEIDKMMRAWDPVRGLHRIEELKLYSTVFQIPEQAASTANGQPGPINRAAASASILNTLWRTDPPPTLKLSPVHPTLASHIRGKAEMGRLYLACALIPYHGLEYWDHKKKSRPLVDAVIRDGLKLGVQCHYLDGIPALFDAWDFVSPKVAALAEGQSPDDRRNIGMFLRNKLVHNPPVITWQLSLLFSLAQDIAALYWDPESRYLNETTASELVTQYNNLVTKIEELGLDTLLSARPLLNGKEILAALELPPGPWVHAVQERIAEWRFEHPDGTKDECVAWLKAEHAAGNIEYVAAGKRPTEAESEPDAKKAKR